MLRPVGGRDEHRTIESLGAVFMKNVVGRFSDNAEISTDVLGQAMMIAGEIGIEGCLSHGIGKMHKMGLSGEEVRFSYSMTAALRLYVADLWFLRASLQALLIRNGDARKLAKVTF